MSHQMGVMSHKSELHNILCWRDVTKRLCSTSFLSGFAPWNPFDLLVRSAAEHLKTPRRMRAQKLSTEARPCILRINLSFCQYEMILGMVCGPR
jgi:hypothetical protein